MQCKDCVWLDTVYKHKTCWTDVSCRDLDVKETDRTCERFISISCSLTKLRVAWDGSTQVDNWLPADYSKAFMICVGAGPWKFKRRQTVQQAALDFLSDRDISELSKRAPEDSEDLYVTEEITCYPFEWQRKMVRTLAEHLTCSGQTMAEFCEGLIEESKKYPYQTL